MLVKGFVYQMIPLKVFHYQKLSTTVNLEFRISLLLVEHKPVNVNWQTLFCILPYIWIFAFYRIEKLRIGIVIAFGVGFVSVLWSILVPFPYGLLGNLVISIGVPIYFIRKWSREWNERISQAT